MTRGVATGAPVKVCASCREGCCGDCTKPFSCGCLLDHASIGKRLRRGRSPLRRPVYTQAQGYE